MERVNSIPSRNGMRRVGKRESSLGQKREEEKGYMIYLSSMGILANL